MSKSLEQIIGFAPLTEKLRTTKSGIPNPFPEELYTVPAANKIFGEQAQYVRISGERRISRRSMGNAPPRARSLRDIGSQPVKLLKVADEFKIDIYKLQQLRSFERWEQDKGMDWLKYQLDSIGKLVGNLEVAAMASMLRHGALYFDSDGILLKDSTGADTNLTIDASVPATHKNQINGLVSSSWALATTDIPTQLVLIDEFSQKETGLPLLNTPGVTALYGANIPGYIARNSFSQGWLARNPKVNERYTNTALLPDGLYGIDKWKKVFTFYEEDDGTQHELWDPDLLVLLPAMNPGDDMGWWGSYEGTHPIPTSFNPTAGIDVNNYRFEHGKWAYSVIDYPYGSGMTVFAGHTFLRIFKLEKAPFMIDTAF